MKYRDLRDFIAQLEQIGELKRVSLTCFDASGNDRNLRPGIARTGSAILFENPAGHKMPCSQICFGTPRRVALVWAKNRCGAARSG